MSITKIVKVKNAFLICVEVSDDANDFHYDTWFTRYLNYSGGSIKLDVQTKIIGLFKYLTELDIEKYIEPSQNTRDDFKELLKANNINLDKNILILEIIE